MASCFKIISCGDSHLPDHEDLQTPQRSSERHGWSFRRRSARHSTSASKHNPEPTVENFQVQSDLTVQEKSLDVQRAEEKTELPIHLKSKLSEENTELSTHQDSNIPEEETKVYTHQDSKLSVEKTEFTHLESKISVDETEFTHQDSEFLEEETKLSTPVDSKLLDTHASTEDEIMADATLDEPSMAQCAQLEKKCIIKLQAAVRGHIVRKHAVGTLRCVQGIIKMQALFRTRHAHLLLQGAVDPSEQRDRNGQRNKVAQQGGAHTCVSTEKLLSNPFARKLMEATRGANPITIKCDPLKSDSVWTWLERWVSVSSVSKEEPQEPVSAVVQHNKCLGHSDPNNENILVPVISKSEDAEFGADASIGVTETDPAMLKGSDLVKVVKIRQVPKMEGIKNDPDLPDLKKPSIQQPEIEVKKISRKASNPAFIAAKSRFEKLSSGATSAKIPTTPSHDSGVQSSVGKVSSSTDSPFASKNTDLAENTISLAENAIYTPDSSNSLKSGVNNGVMEIKVSDENSELEVNSIIMETDPSYTDSNKLERDESFNFVTCESLNSSMDNMPEKDSSHLSNKSSLNDASPRSHATFSDFQATPTSQVSLKPNKSKAGKSGLDRKNRTHKNVPNQDSGSGSSVEHNKSGKRRTWAIPDHREQEPRDSNSSNSSLPSYMQATKSARAKAIANASPRSSPDVYDKAIHIKKRHSLPSLSDREDSPRMLRSLSQAQQTATHSPQDRKWRR